jgi:hypothetical protein
MSKRPPILNAVAVILLITFSRVTMIFKLPTLKLFEGGVNPTDWLGPWVSDSMLGLMAPYVIYLVLASTKGSSPKTWGFLVMYNSVGTFDYTNGVLVQYFHPQDPLEDNEFFLGFIGAMVVLQAAVVMILFRTDVMEYFVMEDEKKNKTQ